MRRLLALTVLGLVALNAACKSFRLSAHFPRRGTGTYRVTYEASGATFGPGTTFRLR
jgi:hypothetical protein